MREHKYLEENGVKREEIIQNLCEENGPDKRSPKWEEERQLYGFDERETWAMDSAFIQWLLERLLMFKDVNIIDLTYHKDMFKGKEITQGEAIDLMIEACKAWIREDDSNKPSSESWKTVTELWSIWGPVMWW